MVTRIHTIDEILRELELEIEILRRLSAATREPEAAPRHRRAAGGWAAGSGRRRTPLPAPENGPPRKARR